LEGPKSYHPISLQCVPFKIFERLIYARVESIVDTLLPQCSIAGADGYQTLELDHRSVHLADTGH